MYFAKNSVKCQFDLYLAFLDEIVQHGSEVYITMFYKILSETQALCKGKKNYTEIPRDHFDIIAILANNHSDFFRKLNVDHMDNSDFLKIAEFLTTDAKSLA
jgi:hypothetical protein